MVGMHGDDRKGSSISCKGRSKACSHSTIHGTSHAGLTAVRFTVLPVINGPEVPPSTDLPIYAKSQKPQAGLTAKGDRSSRSGSNDWTRHGTPTRGHVCQSGVSIGT